MCTFVAASNVKCISESVAVDVTVDDVVMISTTRRQGIRRRLHYVRVTTASRSESQRWRSRMAGGPSKACMAALVACILLPGPRTQGAAGSVEGLHIVLPVGGHGSNGDSFSHTQ